MEEMIRTVFKDVLRRRAAEAVPVMPYGEAMGALRSDKPDLRVKLELTDITDCVRDVDFKVFSAAAALPDGRVAALRVPHGGEMPRSEIDAMTEFVKIYGAKGSPTSRSTTGRRPRRPAEPIVKTCTTRRWPRS